MHRKHATAIATGFMVFGMSLIATAQAQQRPDARPGPGERPPGPPPEAFDACDGLQEGDACSVATPRGDVLAGICHALHERRVCVPDAPPPPPERGRS